MDELLYLILQGDVLLSVVADISLKSEELVLVLIRAISKLLCSKKDVLP